MPKRYEQLSDSELEFILDYGNITDEDASRIIHILEKRESDKRNPIHEEREEEEEPCQ